MAETSAAAQKEKRSYAEQAQDADAQPYVVVAGAVQHALQWVPHKNPVTLAMGTKELLETSEIPEMDEEELVELKTKGRIFQDIPKVKEMYQRLRYAYAAYGGSDENVAIRSHVSQDDIVMSHWQSEPLRPSHYIVRQKNEVILGIRGTDTIADALTDIAGAPVEYSFKKVAGCVHGGMLRSALWVIESVYDKLVDALEQAKEEGTPKVHVVGHSLGGGVASLVAVMLLDRDDFADHYEIAATTFAPAAVVTSEVVDAYSPYMTAIFGENDIVPRFECYSGKQLGMELYEAANIRKQRYSEQLYNSRAAEMTRELKSSSAVLKAQHYKDEFLKSYGPAIEQSKQAACDAGRKAFSITKSAASAAYNKSVGTWKSKDDSSKSTSSNPFADDQELKKEDESDWTDSLRPADEDTKEVEKVNGQRLTFARELRKLYPIGKLFMIRKVKDNETTNPAPHSDNPFEKEDGDSQEDTNLQDMGSRENEKFLLVSVGKEALDRVAVNRRMLSDHLLATIKSGVLSSLDTIPEYS